MFSVNVQKTCMQCGYRNLPSATVCFQCSSCLETKAITRMMKPRHHALSINSSLAERHDITLEETPVDLMRNEPMNSASKSQYNAPLVCLRCGNANRQNVKQCIYCGAHLIVPDEIHQLVVSGSARSSIGQVRSNNEDNVGLWARSGVILGLVADGMGGAAAGEEASRLAKEAVQAAFVGAAHGSEGLHEMTNEEIRRKLRLAIHDANWAMLRRVAENGAYQGMGTTMTLALVRGNHLMVAHVGDSRAYLVKARTGWISQITDDHSFVEALIASGHITPAQAAVHPMRSVLYRALGQADISEPDLYNRIIEPGDRIILSSDGLPRHVTAKDITRLAMESSEPAEISQSLIDLANKNGGEDNVSVVVLVVSADKSIPELEKLVPLRCEEDDNRLLVDDPEKTGKIPDIPGITD